MIRIEQLFKKFGDKEILKGINLTVAQGETLAIIGPSGSGKSTLLRCINFLEEPTAGRIWIDDVELTQQNAMALRSKVAMVFQHFNLFQNMNVMDNVLYGPIKVLKRNHAEVLAKVNDLFEQVGLNEKKEAYPHALSGGQKQRVAIIRALALEPEAILFDEPTSALDPEMVKEVLEVIKGLAHTGITIIMNTHEMGFAREVADRIAFLDKGEIVEMGQPKEILLNPKTNRVKDFLDKVL